MDSTPPSLKALSAASVTKLPIKRKSPFNSTHIDPVHVLELVASQSQPIVPELTDRSPTLNLADPIPTANTDYGPKPPPFKFHRIWTEPDEIRFLQGLLDASSDGHVFPRNLQLFYDHFSTSMSQPYSKSQLSEKLRRLRKKFRVTSARLSRGLDPMKVSPHDRALYELSHKLWSPEFTSSSPFVNDWNKGNGNGGRNNVDASDARIGIVKLGPLSSSLRFGENPNQIKHKGAVDVFNGDGDVIGVGGNHNKGVVVKMSDVSTDDCDFAGKKENLQRSNCGLSLGGLESKTVLNVFDQCLKEFRVSLLSKGLKYSLNESGHSVSLTSNAKDVDFERRWQEQRAVELDVFAKRLRLVLEKSLHRQ